LGQLNALIVKEEYIPLHDEWKAKNKFLIPRFARHFNLDREDLVSYRLISVIHEIVRLYLNIEL